METTILWESNSWPQGVLRLQSGIWVSSNEPRDHLCLWPHSDHCLAPSSAGAV